MAKATVEEMKRFIAESLNILTHTHEEIIQKLYTLLKSEEKNFTKEQALAVCTISDEDTQRQERIIEEIHAEHAHQTAKKEEKIDIHANKDLSRDPRDEDARYVADTMQRPCNDPDDPLCDYLDDLGGSEKVSS